MDMNAFIADIIASPIEQQPFADPATQADLYSYSTLSSILDKHAPLKSRFVVIRPTLPYYTDAKFSGKA